MRNLPVFLALLTLCMPVFAAEPPVITGEPWARHTIDDTSEGADGVRLMDVNGDGLPDIATPWEEGGIVRAYLHPGLAAARTSWPQVTVGNVRSPEDAVFADLDSDGAVDVVSACEGDAEALYVHWAPADPEAYRDAEAWTTAAIPTSEGHTRWMFVLPMDVNGNGRTDLVAGSKNPNAVMGWLEAPPDPRDLDAWTFHKLRAESWIMSVEPADINGDGDMDVLYSDRKAPATRGCWWFEKTDRGFAADPHYIGGREHEVMFLTDGDLDGDGAREVLACTKDNGILHFTPANGDWTEAVIPMPADTGTGKGIAVGDMDGDGAAEIVFSCEHASGAHGVAMLKKTEDAWQATAISGKTGTKFDLVKLLDLDGDGDLDVLTCEENEQLGVFWYENPGT
ncbi:MAG: FG-GAP repeat domain-containing protein [Candidatus Hydrogenedentota bacterium]